ncbi:origin of replication complex subunit 4 isoform X1 [Cryptomeria japonica]|uniref:origin of replication complex subunit 4 isoform X1 n=2 Tax=Cryptomeria japonica TaxID=3369 RepID=UPI0027DA9543|nr:origin of replication complex subunit 4 isoform X1 [Cryptomeria japonica]
MDHYLDGASIEDAVTLFRRRLCDSSSLDLLLPNASENYSKLRYLLSNTVTNTCNNSVLLLGPRGCGKSMVLERVMKELQHQHSDMISIVRLNGLLHSDDRCALKEIAKQLCLEHHLTFSKTASFDENSQFMIAMLRECALAHKAVIFVLDEFDLFAQGKQRVLYNLLDTMQSVLSQAAVVGISCRLDADQLLEKRVRSRFSHRKLLFSPPSTEDLQRLLEQALILPTDSTFPHVEYAARFNARLTDIIENKSFKDILSNVVNVDLSVRRLLDFLFRAVCDLDRDSGLLSLRNFRTAVSSIQRQPKLETLRDASVLELYLLVSMKRLESKDCDSYNFNAIMKEYMDLHNAHPTCDLYSRQICLRAFEHLLERQLIAFIDKRGQNIALEFRPVKLLVASHELNEGLKTSPVCPVVLRQWFDHEKFK